VTFWGSVEHIYENETKPGLKIKNPVLMKKNSVTSENLRKSKNSVYQNLTMSEMMMIRGGLEPGTEKPPIYK
jgi:hypothetical protein